MSTPEPFAPIGLSPATGGADAASRTSTVRRCGLSRKPGTGRHVAVRRTRPSVPGAKPVSTCTTLILSRRACRLVSAVDTAGSSSGRATGVISSALGA